MCFIIISSNLIASSPSWIFPEKNLVMDEMIADGRRKHSTPSIIVLHLRGRSLMLMGVLVCCDDDDTIPAKSLPKSSVNLISREY
jgi:hypothetical protein